MFSDKYGLTKAVLEERKTQTRRFITYPLMFKDGYVAGFHVYRRKSDGFISEVCMYDANERDFDDGQIIPKYKIGEIVAVAESYRNISSCGFSVNSRYDLFRKENWDEDKRQYGKLKEHKGWTNKMFVKPELMPHQIRITNVRIERLQDISDDDCLSEGIEFDGKAQSFYCGLNVSTNAKTWLGRTPREAYSALIDKISGKGTWQSNPYVFAYDFELVK